MRGEWTEEVETRRFARLRRAGDSAGQMCCGCLAVLALLIVSCSFFYFIFGMASVLANVWDIVGHWLLLK